MLRRYGLLAFSLVVGTGTAPVHARAEQPPSANLPAASADLRFVGHYYLSGVRETGSEMTLNDNGTYDWVFIVGGLDLFSKGRWHRAGEKLILTPSLPDKNLPLFTISKVEPWNEAAEQKAQEEAMVQRNTAREKLCPFLTENDRNFPDGEGDIQYVAKTMALSLREVTPVMIEKAKRSALREATARKTYENAAAIAMANGRDEYHRKARAARLSWLEARDHMQQAQSDAGQRFVQADKPRLPTQCILEEWAISPGNIERQEWIGGVAVYVGDTERGIYFNNVPVRFHLESGASLDRKTESGGIAWIPRNVQNRVASITVTGNEEAGEKQYPFVIGPISEGFITVNIDSQAITRPAFRELVLTIDGDDLIGFEGRGRYSRSGQETPVE